MSIDSTSCPCQPFPRIWTSRWRKERKSGRMTVNKLRRAVSAVLGAWTEWGVYNATFVDDLEAHFEGREVRHDRSDDLHDFDASRDIAECPEHTEVQDDVVIHGQRGDWEEVSDEQNVAQSLSVFLLV